MAQDFSASELGAVKVKLDNMFASGQGQYRSNIASVSALASRQVARFQDLDVFRQGCRGVDVIYMIDNCADVAADCDGTDCTITGLDIDSGVESLANNICLDTEFTVDTDLCGNAFTVEDARAHGLARAIKKIEDALNLTVLTDTVGVDSFPPRTPAAANVTAIGAALVDTYKVDLASWTDGTAIGKILTLAGLEGLVDPYIMSGVLLYESWVNAQVSNPGCCNMDHNFMTGGPADIVFDLTALDPSLATTAGDHAVLAVDPSATVFWNSYDYSPTPVSWGDQNASTVWSIPSPRLTFSNGGTQVRVWYDVMRQITCDGTGGKMRPVEKYRVSFKGGFHLAPDPCDDGTRIIQFTDDAGA